MENRKVIIVTEAEAEAVKYACSLFKAYKHGLKYFPLDEIPKYVEAMERLQTKVFNYDRLEPAFNAVSKRTPDDWDDLNLLRAAVLVEKKKIWKRKTEPTSQGV